MARNATCFCTGACRTPPYSCGGAPSKAYSLVTHFGTIDGGEYRVAIDPETLEGADLVEYLWGMEAREQYERGLKND